MSLLAALLAAASVAAPCRAAQLRLAPTAYGEAGGQFVQTLTVTNAGAASCSVAGWPSLRRVPSIRVVQRPVRRLVLAPKGVASFDVYGADYDALANKACPTTHALLVAVPGTSALPVAVKLPHCGPFYVAPLIAGRSDRDAWSVVWARRWCRIGQFDVTVGPRVGEATGQHTLVLRLANRGSSCTVFGYPTVSFADARGRIPFVTRTGTDMMIRATYALPVVVHPGGNVFAVMNNYRCDLGDKRVATVVRIGLTGTATAAVPIRMVDYCGPGDPGSTVTVAPFEPTVRAALQP